jgi:hypothetical protein
VLPWSHLPGLSYEPRAAARRDHLRLLCLVKGASGRSWTAVNRSTHAAGACSCRSGLAAAVRDRPDAGQLTDRITLSDREVPGECATTRRSARRGERDGTARGSMQIWADRRWACGRSILMTARLFSIFALGLAVLGLGSAGLAVPASGDHRWTVIRPCPMSHSMNAACLMRSKSTMALSAGQVDHPVPAGAPRRSWPASARAQVRPAPGPATFPEPRAKIAAPPAHGCSALTLLCTGGSRHRARLLKRTAMKRCSTVWIHQSGSKRYSILPYAPASGATPGRGWPVLVSPGCHRGWLSAKRIHGVHQLVLVDPVADEVLVRFFHLVVVPPEHVDAE